MKKRENEMKERGFHDRIWIPSATQKIQTFIWLAIQNRLRTRMFL